MSTFRNRPSTSLRMLLERFWTHVKKLVEEKASAKDLIALCDQLRDTHLREPGHLPRGTGPAVAHRGSRQVAACGAGGVRVGGGRTRRRRRRDSWMSRPS